MDVWTAITHLRAARYAELDAHFNGLQAAYEQGTLDDLSLAHQFCLGALARVDLIPAVEAWVAAFPQSYAAHHALASLQVRVAWEARGEATSDVTSAKQFAQMRAHFDQAMPHVDKAISLSKKPVLTLVVWTYMCMAASEAFEKIEYARLFESLRPQSALLSANEFGRLNPKWGGSMHSLEHFMSGVRQGTWTDAQINTLESLYLCELADVARCSGNTEKAIDLTKQALAKARCFEALALMAELKGINAPSAASIPLYEEALAIEASARSYYFLGGAQEAKGLLNDAASSYQKALELGRGEAAARLVWLYLPNAQSEATRARVASWFDQGVAQYSQSTMLARGNFFFNGHCDYPKDPKQIAHWWHMAGEWGSATALYNLTLSYWDGRDGFPKDYAKAFAAAKQSADLGDRNAYACVGRMYYLGHGTPVDYAAALPYLAEAAQNDDPRSTACLIQALWFGQGTAVDRNAAQQWLDHLRTIDEEEYTEVKGKISGVGGWMRAGMMKLKGKT
jgi:TPR repeat protein